ncbi:MAG: efflux RND transporter permease subunit, partial [Clostridiales bacterium]|nr:efflux RND transporter permease subunit [Clostridiales bacterium]
MKKIIEEMLRHRIIILIISVLLIVSGIYSYINIPKEEMPKIETIYGYVQIVAPGLNNQEIADKISSPIEDIINDYSNVESFKTTSIDNASIILIEMGIGDTTSAETLEKIKTDVLNANIDERISSIDFITNMKTGEVIYAVHSESLSEMQLMQIADDLAKHLQGVENISRAKLNTAYSEEIVVTVDYDMLNSMPITLLDVFNVIMANGMELPLGNASFDDKSASILIDANYTTTGEIQDLVLFSDGETTYLISDIAKVVKKNTKNKKVYEFNGEITAFVEVFFDEDIDYTVLGDEIEDAVKEFTDTQTEEVSITSMTFSPKYVSEQVNSVMKNLLLCIAIVMLVVLIGLGFRNAIAIAITIPVIVMATIGVLYIMGNHLQLMSIAGLIVSIGILVDNSIVISEAVQHELNIGRDIKTACVNAIKDNYLPVLTSTLTTVAAFIPLMYLPGVAGDVAFTLPLTILIAISLSYVIAMTLTPTLAKMFFKRKKYKKKKIMKFNKKIRRSMKSIFKLSLAPTIIAFLVLGVLSYLVVMRLEIDILPKTEKSIVYIDYEYNEINDDTGTYDFAKDIEVIVKDQDNVISYAFSQGGDLPKFYMTLDVVNNLPHNGRFFIEFDCKAIELEGYMKNLEDDLQESGNIVVNRLELAQPSAPVQILLLSNEYENLESVSMDIYSEVEKLD